ncbi:tyrosine-protein kinase family protein, partial [Streptomyces scabiei]|uniref:tyrosine-protein kinase family protein n=1 Tax=Streptomyces scabiei TaxID=1930 RepID=UPI0038F69138
TFVSVNLSLAIASPKRRTIIVGSDIRNPQLQRYNKESKNYVGLTEYLHDMEVSVESIIRKSRVSGDLDVIFSGMIPPNPTELLNN